MSLHGITQGEGPLLVLLHGWGFSHLVWQDLIPHLSSHYTVMNIDLPGFGKSKFDENIHSLATFSEAVLNSIPEPATIMGWSLGGLVGQYLAIHHPERVKALIAVASSPCFVKHNHWPGISEFLLHAFAEELIKHYQSLLKRFLALQFFGMEVDRELIKKLSAQIIQDPPNTQALQLGLDFLLNSDLRLELNCIQCPLRFILGKLDVIVPASLAEHLRALNSNLDVELIKGAGHAPFISHPSEFLAASGLLS